MGRNRDVLGVQHRLVIDCLSLLLGRIVRILEIGPCETWLDKPNLDALFGRLLAQRIRETLNAGFRGDVD